MFPARQGGDQHDEGGFGQVEVGDEGVQALEPVAGVDEDIGPPGLHRQRPILVGEGLNGAARGGAHADNPSPIGFGLVHQIRRLLGDGAELRVHIVGFHVVHLHRPEGAQPHVEGHVGQLDPHGLHLFQQLRREVQPLPWAQQRSRPPWSRRSGSSSPSCNSSLM